MSFDIAPEAYSRFMGRWSEPLAVQFAENVDSGPALDVGSGPGALAAELARRLGPDQVTAVDPSEQFVAAVRERLPGLDARLASAEHLPFPDHTFAATLAQLVVHFMPDPVVGLREMRRVTQPGGVVATCVWDAAGGRAPISPFWRGVAELNPDPVQPAGPAGWREGDLERILQAAGLLDLTSTALTVTLAFSTYDDWWRPFTAGAGPVGSYVKRLGDEQLEALRVTCEQILPPAPFELTAVAWSVVGRVG